MQAVVKKEKMMQLLQQKQLCNDLRVIINEEKGEILAYFIYFLEFI